jgi:hypothetical protein
MTIVKELWCGHCDKHTMWWRIDTEYIAGEFECSKCKTSAVSV